jgi:hypothetical protein
MFCEYQIDPTRLIILFLWRNDFLIVCFSDSTQHLSAKIYDLGRARSGEKRAPEAEGTMSLANGKAECRRVEEDEGKNGSKRLVIS